MKIAIFGSCVSRDLVEFMPNSEVAVYIARQSVTSHLSPHGTDNADLDSLSSQFQLRMVRGDLSGNGIASICEQASDIDLVLVDLIDERRGYWLFPDGTTMTNSLEAESCGATAEAEKYGARLVRFGSDEHFDRWQRGFDKLVWALKKSGIWARTIFVDMEWAAAVEGARHPNNLQLAKVGRLIRKNRRRIKKLLREKPRKLLTSSERETLLRIGPTDAEVFADRARDANAEYVRYRMFAQKQLAYSVTRQSHQSRINRNHKWGPQPFHFRDEDYVSVVERIEMYLNSSGIGGGSSKV